MPAQRICRRHHRRGFALIDVIIGGMMLAIGLAVVISMATRSLQTQTDGEKRLIAAWLADELLNMVLVEGPVDYPRKHDTSGRFEWPFEEFTFEVSIENQGPRQPYFVTATVGWEGPRTMRSVEVQTLIAERYEAPDEPREPFERVDRDARWNPENGR